MQGEKGLEAYYFVSLATDLLSRTHNIVDFWWIIKRCVIFDDVSKRAYIYRLVDDQNKTSEILILNFFFIKN